MLKEKLKNQITLLALKALLYEVSAAPKPGLVDSFNSGAHNDMDRFTFIDSTLALRDYFESCFLLGYNNAVLDYPNLMCEARTLGMQAEQKMYLSTNNVNTHKGAIFSMGLICLALGIHLKKHDTINIIEVLNHVPLLVGDITKELENDTLKTYGSQIFKKYNLTGARGEAQSGYQSVLDYGLPTFTDMIQNGYTVNDSAVQTLIHLMANVCDTNILGRHSIAVLNEVKKDAKNILALGGMKTKQGQLAMVKLDQLYIKNRISPGGSADLLAITIFLYYLEREL